MKLLKKIWNSIYFRILLWFIIGLIPWFIHPNWVADYIAVIKMYESDKSFLLDIILPFIAAALFAIFWYFEYIYREIKKVSRIFLVLKIIVFVGSLYINLATVT
jgi:hypothetical protein